MGNLKNKVISSNFQKLLQISSSNEVADGTGSATPLSIDKVNSRIGIGVKNPKLPVDIVGTLNISGSELFPTSGSVEEEFNPEIVSTADSRVLRTREEVRNSGNTGISIQPVNAGIGYQIIENNNEII